ncbi:MAG: adenosylmethionine decarboxylase [Patescibacteria group bacterium]
MEIAYHFLFNITTKSSNNLDDSHKIHVLCQVISKALKTTILESSSNYFLPHGVTTYALLSESHIAIHTWPEKNFMIIDILTCKKPDSDAIQQIKQRIAEGYNLKKIELKEEVIRND